MNQFQAALTFSLWALDFLLLPPLAAPIMGLAAISAMCAAWKQRPFRSRSHWAILTHLLFFPAAIAVGVFLAASTAEGRTRMPNRYGTISAEVLLYASFVSCAFWIWKLKGFRWFAVSLVALMELPIIGALFVAGMSVTGDWL